jgi:hypothetical protein
VGHITDGSITEGLSLNVDAKQPEARRVPHLLRLSKVTTSPGRTQPLTNPPVDTARYNRSKSRAEFSLTQLALVVLRRIEGKTLKTLGISPKLFEIKTLNDLPSRNSFVFNTGRKNRPRKWQLTPMF